MTAPDSRTRRPRAGDTVIDLRQAAAERRPGPPPADVDLVGGDQAFLDTVTGLGGEVLLVHGSPAPVAEVFLAPRLDPAGVRGLGTLPMGGPQAALVVDRALGDA